MLSTTKTIIYMSQHITVHVYLVMAYRNVATSA